jgi:LCP family protein required for cell wall assembly
VTARGDEEGAEVPPEKPSDEAPEPLEPPEPPPPATWAGRRAQGEQPPPAEPPGPDEPPSGPPPPVEEPPEPDAPEPVEEPHGPGVPPSGEATGRQDTVEADPVAAEDPADEDGDADEPGAEEGGAEQAEGEEPEAQDADAKGPEVKESAREEPGAEESAREEPVAEGTPPVPAPVPVAATAGGNDKAPRAGLWPRFFAASFVIVISFATATATSFLLYLTDIAEGLGGIPGVEKQLAEVDGGEPQTVLILGSDIRPDIEDVGRSDTTMLLRLDPDKQVLSLLSLPRDLQVNIPGHGIGKLNEAYSMGGKKGGPQKTVEVVKQLTGLEINHVVNIDFAGFAEAVNAIECVFVDVDRDYFHSNEGIFDESQKFAEIDIDAGYQQLCGYKALQYVRYRHDDNDLVRAARQQSFLREARQKVPPSKLFARRNDFIDIFTKHTTSDIKDPIAMLDVLKLFIELRDVPVRRIAFQGNLGGPDAAYVTASNDQIQAAVNQFLGEAPAPADRAADDDGGGDGAGDGGDGGGRSSDGGGGGEGSEAGPSTALIDAAGDAERFALDFDRKLRFPVIAPVKLKPGSSYSDQSRAYTIDTYDGDHYPAYKLVFPLTGEFGVLEYYGVMGTKWEDPPILENPSETREIGDREYLLFYEGDRLQVVGFKTPRGSYWVSNTLLGALSEAEMLGVAQSMRPYSPEQ